MEDMEIKEEIFKELESKFNERSLLSSLGSMFTDKFLLVVEELNKQNVEYPYLNAFDLYFELGLDNEELTREDIIKGLEDLGFYTV